MLSCNISNHLTKRQSERHITIKIKIQKPIQFQIAQEA